ncbi:MAG: ABC transporter ATP-binding protein, partial [Rhodobiaceae bacterium]|nr:ABC transporter ATP-binding protein [Rhodobiaceae bacterium]
YTRALMAAIPTRETKRGALQGLAGTVPDLIHAPPGCRFAPRCGRATDTCSGRFPPMSGVTPDHAVACYHPVTEPEAADA